MRSPTVLRTARSAATCVQSTVVPRLVRYTSGQCRASAPDIGNNTGQHRTGTHRRLCRHRSPASRYSYLHRQQGRWEGNWNGCQVRTFLMLKQSIKGVQRNPEIARSTMLIADQMEHNLDMVCAQMMSATGTMVKDAFATFVVFTQLKRSADQARTCVKRPCSRRPAIRNHPRSIKSCSWTKATASPVKWPKLLQNNFRKALFTPAPVNPAADINLDGSWRCGWPGSRSTTSIAQSRHRNWPTRHWWSVLRSRMTTFPPSVPLPPRVDTEYPQHRHSHGRQRHGIPLSRDRAAHQRR